jgi:hypothetical protein
MSELRRNLISNAGLARAAVDRRIAAMTASFPDATVTGYEPLVSEMANHEKDRHVLAAAVRAGAEVIVTANLKDFPTAALAPYGITAVHPDDFLLDQLDLYPRVVLNCLDGQILANRREPRTIGGLAARLARCGVPNFAAQVLRH